MAPQGCPPLNSKNSRMCSFRWKGSPADGIMFKDLDLVGFPGVLCVITSVPMKGRRKEGKEGGRED